jgi:hypothetical protein
LPEIAESVSVPAQVPLQPTPLEKTEIKGYVTLEQPFVEVHPLLNGSVRLSLLVDDSGHFATQNAEAFWKAPGEKPDDRWASLWDLKGNEIDRYGRIRENQTCIDGILVAGDPGRDERERLFGISIHPNPINLGLARFVLDIRGQIKPPLTPARNPPESARSFHRVEPRWQFIQSLASEAKGRIWERVAEQLQSGLKDEIFWKLAILDDHGSGIHWMRALPIWSLISVPVVNSDGGVEWRKISSLGVLKPISVNQDGKREKLQLECADKKRIAAFDALTQWLDKQYEGDADWHFQSLVTSMSTIVIKDGEPHLQLRSPTEATSPPSLNLLTSPFSSSTYALPYSHEVAQFLSVHIGAPLRNVNRSHALVREALSAKYLEKKSELQEFADIAVRCIADLQTGNLLTDVEAKIGRWHRNVGYHYEDVDWESVSEDLKPPYRIRTQAGDSIDITHEHLVRWAAAEIDPKEISLHR